MNFPDIMTIPQAAAYAQRPKKSIWLLCRKKLIGQKLGKEYRIYKEDLINLVRGRK